MQDALRSPLVTYNSLQDEHLAKYFSSPHRRRHLRRMGLITRDGIIVDEITIQRRAAYKEHRKRHRDAVATNAVLRANEIEKKRRAEIKNKLEDLAKYERAQKIKMQRLHPMGVQMLRPGPTHSVSSASASVQSHLSQVLKTHRDKMEFDPDQLRGLKQLVQKITGPRMISPTPGRLVPHPPTTPQPQTPAATRVGRGRAARRRPQTAPTRSQNSPMEKSGEAKVQTYSNVMLRLQYLGTNSHLKKGSRKGRLKQKKEGETRGERKTERGGRGGGGGEKVESIMSTEVIVQQQHCGGNPRQAYKGMHKPGDCFTFHSLRHIGMPFALSLYLGGMIDCRVSVCCEYRHRPGAVLGGRSAHFKVVSVEGGTPCYQCQAKRGVRYQVRPKQASMEPTLPEHEVPPQHLPSEWPPPPPSLSSASQVETVPPSSHPLEGTGREEDLGSPHSSVYSPSFHSESQDSSSDEETASDVDSEHSMHSPSEQGRPLSTSQLSHSRGSEGGVADRISIKSESGRSCSSQRSEIMQTSDTRGREGTKIPYTTDHREQDSPLAPSEDQTLPQEEHTRESREPEPPSKSGEPSGSPTDARVEPHSPTNVAPQATPTHEEPTTLSSHEESTTPPDQSSQATDTSPPPTLRTSGGVTIVYALGPVSTSETGTQTEEGVEETSEPSDVSEVPESELKQEPYPAQQQSGESMEAEREGKQEVEGKEKEGEMEVERREENGEVEGAEGEEGEKGEGERGGERSGDEVKEMEGEPGENEEEEENKERTTEKGREEESREEEEGEEEGEGEGKEGRFELKQPQTGEQVHTYVDHRASRQTSTEQEEEVAHANQDLTEPKTEREAPSPSPVTELQSLGVSATPTTHVPALTHSGQLHTAISEHPPNDTSSQDGVTTSAATNSPSPSSTSPTEEPSILLDTDKLKLTPSSGNLPPLSSDAPHSDGQSQSPTSVQNMQEEQPTAVHSASLVAAEEASFEQSQPEHVEEKQRSVVSLEMAREQSQMETPTSKSPEEQEQEDTPAITQPDSATAVSKQSTKANDFQKTTVTDPEHKTKEDEDLTPSDGGQETSHSSTLSKHSLQPSGYINMPGTSEPGSKSESLVQVSEEEFSGSILSQSSTGPESLSSSHSGTQLGTCLDSETHSQRSTVMEDAAVTTQETGTTMTSNRGGEHSTSTAQEDGVDSKLETHPVVLDSQ